MKSVKETRSSQVAKAVADLFLPRQCEYCGGAVQEDSGWQWLCRDCARTVVEVYPPHCLTCGYPYAGMVATERSCPHCEELTPKFETGRTLMLHREAGGALIRSYKYHQGIHLLSDFRRLAAQTTGLRDYVENCVLVPVPLHPVKERERGYNQSQLFACCVVEALGTGTVQPILERVRCTATQTRLNREARILNLKNAFALRKGTVLDQQITYMMVDDVFTTGATLNACAAILLAGGASRIKVLTLAHG